jgi:predicted phage tail protein
VEDGSYVVRVRAIDAQGLEGLSAQRTLVVHARPEPPLLIAPAPDAATTAARPHFQWTVAEPSRKYRIQVSAKDASTPLDDQVVASTTQPLQDLEPGLYQWRVAAIDPVKGQGPWGDAQPFRRVLPGPGVDIPPAKDGSLTLRWTAQPQTARYRLQVARDAEFSAPLTDETTDSAQFNLHGLAPGPHFVRVQATGSDGYTGPWGSTQSFTVPEPDPQYWRALLLLLPLAALL